MTDLEMLKQAQVAKRRNWVKIIKLAAAFVAPVVAIACVGITIQGCENGRVNKPSELDKVEARVAELTERYYNLKDKYDHLVAQAKVEVPKPQAAAPAPTPVATPTPKVRGTFGVIISTLYRLGQRKLFKDESTTALDTCSDDTIKLELVFVETGNTKRLRHETKAVAMAKSGMTEKQAQAKAVCLHEELPPVVKRDKDGKVVTGDDGKPVMAKVVTEVVDGTKEPYAKAPVVQAE